jgi:hypothetical protein
LSVYYIGLRIGKSRNAGDVKLKFEGFGLTSRHFLPGRFFMNAGAKLLHKVPETLWH